jgi:predicted TIM-barrel fold metal-dependent hydrolase
VNAPIIIDAEVHLLHPEACHPDFAAGLAEPVRQAIHDHPDFELVRPKLSLDALLSSMELSGISHAVIMGMPWLDRTILADNNAFVAECAAQHPERFRALYIPHIDDPFLAAEEVMHLDTALFAGVKLIPGWQGTRIDDPALAPLIEAVKKRDLFLMVHTDHPTQSLDGDTPFRLLQFLRNYPEVKVLAPHLGGLLCLYGLLPTVRGLLDNVHFITSVSATMEMVSFAAQVLEESIIFGTDFPFNHCHSQIAPLEAVRQLDLSLARKNAILGGTARKLFRI